jgi:hypothetical protein
MTEQSLSEKITSKEVEGYERGEIWKIEVISVLSIREKTIQTIKELKEEVTEQDRNKREGRPWMPLFQIIDKVFKKNFGDKLIKYS